MREGVGVRKNSALGRENRSITGGRITRGEQRKGLQGGNRCLEILGTGLKAV